uniref:Uncharacterized protein n=1 Tax=Tetraselmis sp. GSL018 TaxID=582737 RepID=A0A061SID1_9CHLO
MSEHQGRQTRNVVPAHTSTYEDHRVFSSGNNCEKSSLDTAGKFCKNRFSFRKEEIVDGSGTVLKFFGVEVDTQSGCPFPLTWSRALELFQQRNGLFLEAFIFELREAPFKAFFFEAPPLERKRLPSKHFEFILRESYELAKVFIPDKHALAEHLIQDVNVFPNLGGDCLLVSPKQMEGTDASAYCHLAQFVRNAPEEQVKRTFAMVGASTLKRLAQSRRPVWLSTSGLGVYWLHFRLDEYPKYYTYHPYVATDRNL